MGMKNKEMKAFLSYSVYLKNDLNTRLLAAKTAGFRLITNVKQRWDCFILWWVTTWAESGTLSNLRSTSRQSLVKSTIYYY